MKIKDYMVPMVSSGKQRQKNLLTLVFDIMVISDIEILLYSGKFIPFIIFNLYLIDLHCSDSWGV